jgi:hypothetical protein
VTSSSGRNKVIVPTRLGDYPVYPVGNGSNGISTGTATPIVRDHR